MRELYVLLLYLPSTFGRLSQIATRYPYTHVAISLDDSFTYFYAFSRLRGKTPPISGYIEEKRIYYTLGADVPIRTKIFRVPVTREGYDRAAAYMEEVKRDPEIMYNLLNMLLIPIFGGHPVYKAFHCGEFIARVLEEAGIQLRKPYFRYTPKLFAELLGEYEIYEGILENDLTEGMEDDFFRETPRREYVAKTCYIIRELLYRQIFHKASPGFRAEAVRFVTREELGTGNPGETGTLGGTGTAGGVGTLGGTGTAGGVGTLGGTGTAGGAGTPGGTGTAGGTGTPKKTGTGL